MSQPRTVIGHSIPGPRQRRRGAFLLDFWRHPVVTVRRWRFERRAPRPEDFDRMNVQDFETYVRDIGFDARIKAALAEADASAVQPDADERVPAGQVRP
jgi:hypothetical protein